MTGFFTTGEGAFGQPQAKNKPPKLHTLCKKKKKNLKIDHALKSKSIKHLEKHITENLWGPELGEEFQN